MLLPPGSPIKEKRAQNKGCGFTGAAHEVAPGLIRGSRWNEKLAPSLTNLDTAGLWKRTRTRGVRAGKRIPKAKGKDKRRACRDQGR